MFTRDQVGVDLLNPFLYSQLKKQVNNIRVVVSPHGFFLGGQSYRLLDPLIKYEDNSADFMRM